MAKINKKPEKYIVLENENGGRVALAIQKKFSSTIAFREVYSNGDLTFESTNKNILSTNEIKKYRTVECESREDAEHVVDNGIHKGNLQGTSDILE